MSIEFLAHGYAYRLRPISQASRSQRMFYSLAKSFAALPKVASSKPTEDDVESLSSSLGASSLAGADGNVFERLLEIGDREGVRADEAERAVQEEPEEMTPLAEVAPVEPPLVDQPAKIARRPRITTATSNSSLPQVARFNRSQPTSPTGTAFPARNPAKSSSASSAYPRSNRSSPTTSAATTPTHSRPNSPGHSRSSSLSSPAASYFPPQPPKSATHDTHHSFPTPFAFTQADLPRLHANLQARLVPFFGQKLAGRKVRLSVYPALPSGSLWDQPLATKVVSTGSGGGFRTNLEVGSRGLRKLLEESKAGVESLDGLRVRIVAELLENDPVQDLMTGGGLLAHQGLRATAEDESELLVGKDGGVRVISDIDDTIKVRLSFSRDRTTADYLT